MFLDAPNDGNKQPRCLVPKTLPFNPTAAGSYDPGADPVLHPSLPEGGGVIPLAD